MARLLLTINWISVLVVITLVSACSTTHENRNPLNTKFPEVSGQSLAKEKISMPDHFSGNTIVLLLGYVQNAQFDIDRWLIGLDMTKTVVDVYELPTIQGMLPRFFSTKIDSGMRKGIPKELWKGVITVYKDGDRLQAYTGNENPNNARVVVLDENANVIYFYDRGFSVSALNGLRAVLPEPVIK